MIFVFNGVISQTSEIWGVTKFGGPVNPNGTIFKTDSATGIYTRILDFDDPLRGKHPKGGLIEASNGKLYGMTFMGGVIDEGVLFEFDPLTNIFTKRIDFNAFVSEKKPEGELFEASNGKIYGMAIEGGSNGFGTLFDYTISTGVLVVRANFNGAGNSRTPVSGFVPTNGKLYGVTTGGGNNGFPVGNGTIFEINLITNTLVKKSILILTLLGTHL